VYELESGGMDTYLEIPALPPRSIVLTPPLTDEEFETLSEKTEFAIVERSSKGAIVVSDLSGGLTSSANAEINMQFRNWSKRHRSLMHCGFFLSDGSCLSPDLSYISETQRDALARDQRDHFLRLAPEFVIELVSQSDNLRDIEKKMEVWIANGVELGWLIDPEAKQVHIYAPGCETRVESGLSVAGSGPVGGFVLDLEEVWRCYE
jgi:Uma2 family endonuclease